MNQRQERLPLVSPSPLGQDESTGSQVQRRLCASALSPRSLYGWEWLRLTLVSVLLREAGDWSPSDSPSMCRGLISHSQLHQEAVWSPREVLLSFFPVSMCALAR